MSPLAVKKCAQDEYQLQTVVAPLDGSTMAEAVLPHAEGLAQELSLEVRLLRVVSLGPLTYYGGEGGRLTLSPDSGVGGGRRSDLQRVNRQLYRGQGGLLT